MDDVLIVGAGPAGAIAGLILARAGVRVRILDRASFPRDKLCGDTVNPGTLARLRALGVAGEIESRGLRVEGMLVTSTRFAVEGRYPAGLCGRALVRRELDWILLQHAVAAGCRFEPGVIVAGAALDGERVGGVRLAGAIERRLDARITIGADGRRSAVAFGLGLARHPVHPRRWAAGAYFTDVRPASEVRPTPAGSASDVNGKWTGRTSEVNGKCNGRTSDVGEMHVRRNCYIGVAPVGHNLTNVCVVKPSRPADADLHDPERFISRTVHSDPWLAARFAGARMVTRPTVLGPLAVDGAHAAIDGLLLAGDAAGFIDPMTGDGLRFAIRGAELAAAAALEALEHGWTGVHARLAARRSREFAGKHRFNRGLRALVGSPALVGAATVASRVAPAVLRRVIAHAGDCDLAAPVG